MRIIEIQWIDAHGTEGFITIENIKAGHKPRLVSSIGYEIINDKLGISIIGCHNKDSEEHDRHLFIPREMIKKIRQV